MRLHRIALRNFRGVTHRDLAFEASGVTVVVGDNETGKSSLLEALDLLLTLPDDSKAGRLRAIQPAGRDVPTEVEAEIGLGDLRVHYRKQWFRQRATELRVEPDGRTWTGRAAHDEATRLFADHVDQTLWGALAAGQEHSLAVPVSGAVTAVLTALDEVAGGEVDHGESVPLVSAVEREYLRYFTPTGRPTAEYAEVAGQVEVARASAADAEASLAGVEEDVAKAERLRRERAGLTVRVEEQMSRVAELTGRRHAATELIAQVERLRRDADVATERRAAARGEVDRRRLLVTEATQREHGCAAAVQRAREASGLLQAAERELDRHTGALRTAREEASVRRSTVRRLEDQLTWLRDNADLSDLEARLASVEDARAEELRRIAELNQVPVTDGAVEAAEAAHLQVLAARAARSAAAPKLRVRRLGSAEVQVAGRPVTEPSSEVAVEADTTVVVAGVVELTVQPGAGAADLAASFEHAEHAERELLDELGATNIAELRQLARRRSEVARALAAARETVAGRLAGATLGDLVARRDTLRARLAAAAPPAGERMPGGTADDARVALRQAQEDEAATSRVLATAEEHEAMARKQFESVSAEATAAGVRAEQELERREDARAAVAAARAASTDDDLAEALSTVELELSAVTGELARAEDVLGASGIDRTEERLVEAESLRGQLAAQVDELRDELRLIEGRLEMAGIQGLASAAERAHADLANAEARFEVLERRARAAARLRETLERHRAAARQRYSAPLRERIVALGQVVFGPSFGVVLGPDLEVQARTIDGVGLPVAALSTGAREQLATVVRLAIAGLTASDGSGVPVVLDDALGWSDPGRLEAMGSLLAQAGTSSQVILLTCVPDRYLGTVAGAHTVRM